MSRKNSWLPRIHKDGKQTKVLSSQTSIFFNLSAVKHGILPPLEASSPADPGTPWGNLLRFMS